MHHQSANETTERDRNSPQFPYRRLHELNRRRPHQLAASPLVAIQNNGRTPHRLVVTLYSRLQELNRPLPPSACLEPPRAHPEHLAHTTAPSHYPLPALSSTKAAAAPISVPRASSWPTRTTGAHHIA